jgi:acetoin utilization deacetylase AcuC-like enzyme
LSKEGLVRRDRLILEGARRLGIPVAIVLGGGYAHEPDDTVAAHLNTIRIATAVRRRIGPGERPVVRPPSLVRRPARSKDA